MIIYDDLCVGCPPEICRGGCSYRELIPIHICDNCERNDDDCLYIYDGQELCFDCVYKKVKEDNADKITNDENDNLVTDIIEKLDTIIEDL